LDNRGERVRVRERNRERKWGDKSQPLWRRGEQTTPNHTNPPSPPQPPLPQVHKMIFAMQQLPGEFTTFDFIPGIPAPFNFGLAILLNQKMLTFEEKLQTAPPLLPMLLEGQPFIDAQDELSVTEFMRKYGMPERINEEVFIAMAKALDFIDPDKLSMTVVLTAMNRFLNEDNGLQMAFLDGNQPDRLCEPMKKSIEKNGGTVLVNSPVKEIVTNPDGTVKHLLMRSGEEVVADEYVSAMPVDVMRRFVPKAWSPLPFFRQLDELEGIPVINLHMWFDRKLKAVDHLCFSRSPLLSVYADMSVTCKEYYDEEKSMLELVFAPCSPLAGGEVNWIAKSDEDIIDATMGELARLFPTEIAADDKWPSTKGQVRVWFLVCLSPFQKSTFLTSPPLPLPLSLSPLKVKLVSVSLSS
jgi:15-cis-phytoene desaturase